MNILAIETSGGCGSIALSAAGRLHVAQIATPRRQTEELLTHINNLLEQAELTVAELDTIAFGRGPGSFIGVRLGACVAQGLAVAGGIAMAPVSSMAAMAQGWFAAQDLATARVFVCMDARMDEVYAAAFEFAAGTACEIAPETLTAADQLSWPEGPFDAVLGNATAQFPDIGAAAQRRAPQLMPDAAAHARDLLPFAGQAIAAGQLVDPAGWQPNYLRGESAWRTLK